ncbi:uncharacterized protein TOT_030000083 [Theileria orientalis strain Shintoku]|uniref:DEAD-box family helicase n=1 Tax=Theileria orientalis strain Shintoku TaxID=869250 RepID=J4C3P9_THEOR|nr:uncharacterized protein TOT_030000083 [Theileria orientalis strain Shintoku]BAM40821.1 uncharacterized protein TOT_030000083 [Theileria orientalis strain Shintoku]|eukprot:XP_009691122.1 uncharacterized protein TOT_030000083 [Theileria orientalis strain Shintoku]
MNRNVHVNLIIQIIAILRICTIECGFINPKFEQKAFVTHFGSKFKNSEIGSTVIANLPFDPGGVQTTEEHVEDLKKVFLFNVAHKLKDGRKLLDSYTVPLSKQKLAVEHFNRYFAEGYEPKAKRLEEIISNFESTKSEISETVRSIQDVFLSEILGKYEYKEDITDQEALSRQVDLMYAADLMASYILLFTRKMVRRVLYKFIWTKFAFLDANKEYLCCNWIVNGGVHDTNLHKKFTLEELTNEDLINIIRLHKNYLTFVKVKSRRVLSMLDRSALLSIFQTILMRSIWAHYVHEPSSLSIEKPKRDEEEEKRPEEYVSLIEAEPEEEEEKGEQGYLDNIYEWMIRYRNKLNSSRNVKGINYLNSEEFDRLKESLSSMEKLLVETAPKPEYKSTKAGRTRVKTDEDSKRKELRQSLKALIEYYKDHLRTVSGIYGKIEERPRVEFLNNLVRYEKNVLLNMVVVYLSAIPELKQIRSKQTYLHYMTLSRITLVKLLYVALMRTNAAFVPLINHFYKYDFSFLSEEETRNLEEKMMRERKEIIEKNNFTLDTQDILIFDLDELEGLIDINAKVNRNMQRKWTRINRESKQVMTLGTRRTEEVIRSILKHPPHYKIVLQLLNENQYDNEVIKENIEYLNANSSTDEREESGGSEGGVEERAEENVHRMIRNKKMEVIVSLMKEDELNKMYYQFLQYVYPFNTMNPSEKYKEYLEDQELGDEEVQIENDNIIFSTLKGEVNEENINEMIYKCAKAEASRKYATQRESIISYLSKTVEENGKCETEDEEKMESDKEVEKVMKLSEKTDIELIEEAKKHVKMLEEDPRTLRIKMENCRSLGGRANVFTILPSGKKENYRNMTLRSMEEDDKGFEINNVVIRRKREEPRRYSNHIFDEGPREKIEKMEFGEDLVEKWTKLGLNENVANAAVSYIAHLYNERPISAMDDDYINSISGVGDYNNGGLDDMSKSSGLERISVEKRQVVQPPVRPSLIQMLSIPEMLKKERKNMVICGGVGSGKTLAYMLPILQKLKEHERWKLREPSSPRCIILAPTSELCDQIGKVVKELSHMVKISSETISKDCTAKVIKSKLKGLVDVVVAMPSKLHKYRKYMKLNQLRYVVIEEADCMLNEGFFPQVYSILQQTPNYSRLGRRSAEGGKQQVQIVQVASNISYLKFFESIQSSFKKVELYKHILDYYFSPLNKKKNETFVYNEKIIEDIVGSYKVVDEIGITRPRKGIRHITLINLLNERGQESEDRKIVIFCRKVKAAIAIDHYLNESGYEPITIHGEMPFKMRRRNFREFKKRRTSILVTTELMSRGLNLDADVVVLFDFPLNANDYIRKSSLLIHTPFLTHSPPLNTTPLLKGAQNQVLETGSSGLMEHGKARERQKICIGLIDKKDEVLSEAIRRSLMVDYFPLNKLSSRRKDYNHLTGTLKYLTQAGCYYKFMKHLRELKVEGTFDAEQMHKYLDRYRELVKEQFVNSFKKVKLRRVRICKRRRELMRKLKMLKKWNKAIRLKQRIISDLDRKKREKDYIYVGLTKDQRSCPPMKDLKKVRYELLKLKLLKGSNNEKILKRSQNQICKFINRLQTKLVERLHLRSKLQDQPQQVSIFEQVKDKLELIRSEDRNKNVRRICSLV